MEHLWQDALAPEDATENVMPAGFYHEECI